MASGHGGLDRTAIAPTEALRLPRQQLSRELPEPVEAAEVDAVATGPADVVGDPRRDGTGRKRFRVEQVDEPAIPEALSADELLAARRDARHDQGPLVERERLTHRVVTAHADQAPGARRQAGRLADGVDDGEGAIC